MVGIYIKLWKNRRHKGFTELSLGATVQRIPLLLVSHLLRIPCNFWGLRPLAPFFTNMNHQRQMNELKAIARDLGVEPTGDRRSRETWKQVIAQHQLFSIPQTSDT